MYIPKPSNSFHSGESGINEFKLIDCLNPLVITIRLLGIELNPWKLSCYFRFIGTILLIINVSCNTYFSGLSFYRLVIVKDSNFLIVISSSSEMWSLIIDFGSHNLLSIGVHGVLFFMTRQTKWKLLLENLQQLAKNHSDPDQFKTKCRRAVDIGLFLLIVVGY